MLYKTHMEPIQKDASVPSMPKLSAQTLLECDRIGPLIYMKSSTKKLRIGSKCHPMITAGSPNTLDDNERPSREKPYQLYSLLNRSGDCVGEI